MLKVGLTGSIGSGKSLVARIFRSFGVMVFEADIEAKEFLLQDQVKEKIASTISKNVFDSKGHISNKKLAEIVFNKPDALSVLNKIIHPLVREQFKEWLVTNNEENYILHEAAILYESGFYADFDKVITVSAPEELRIKRVMLRDSVSEEQVLQRMSNQLPDDKKVNMADYVILNNENKMLIPQVLDLHNYLNTIANNY